jgi:uncharacterized protein YutE (UPF0331/DUF86 family)
MSAGNQNNQLTEKDKVIRNSKELLEHAELWTLVRTDENGFVHVHADSEVDLLGMLVSMFQGRPDLKEDLDTMLKMEGQQPS